MQPETPVALPDSRPIYRLIRRTRHLLRSSWVATGLGLSIGLGLCTLVVLTLIDLTVPLRPITWTVGGRVVPVASWLRLLALLLVVVPAGWAFFVGVVRPLFRRLAAVQVARRIESHIPGIHNRLVSCIDLEKKGTRTDVSPVFYRRLLTEALDRIRGVRPGMVLDYLSLRRAMLFALAASLSFGLLWCLFSDRAARAMARIFQPFADLPPISHVAYTVEPGDADVLREEPIAFAVRTTSEADPEEMRLELYNDAGLPPHKYELNRDKDDPKLWAITVDGTSLGDGYENGFRYRVYGGDTWSIQHTIHLVERPVLVSVGSAVYYPKYMGIPEAHPTPPQATEVTGPEGGEFEVRVEARGQVADGDIQMLRPAIRAIPRQEQEERVWFEDKAPFGAATEGTWSWERREGRIAHTEPAAVGTHRHWFQGAPSGHGVGNNDILFAYVFIPVKEQPEAVMLQWHDGDSWEHGAYWGADRIREFKANTPARRHIGELPAAGRWVRLEVSAKQVGLEGKTIRGMSFILHGGRCFWGRTGTVQVEESAVEVTKTYPMRPEENGLWSGRFPLTDTGLFRAELRNQQGHANKPMKELKYVALPDKPPQVILERQSNETVLSKAAALPLAIKAFDDYGLAEVNVLTRDKEQAPYRRRTLQSYPTPKRDDNLVSSLTEGADLKQGAVLRYVIEAKDRKGQTARTREYVLRIAADTNAADQQLTQFEKTQDTFRDRLVKLIAEQKKVQGTIEKLNKEYAKLTDEVREKAEAKSEEQDPAKTQRTKFPDRTPNLVPETAKQLAELRKQLDQLSKEEDKNASQAQQISNDLAKAVEQAGKLEMLPRPIAEQMQATQQAFQNHVADAMRDLGRQMSRDADGKQTPAPNLNNLQQRGDRLQKEMESIKDRLDALANARKGVREDLQKALEQLQRDLLRETGKLTERELEQLRDFLAQMREQMKRLQDKQDGLMKGAIGSEKVAALKRKQEDLDKQIEEMLARAGKLLGDRRRKSDKPEFPESPYTPDGKEVKVPPREEDTNEPLPGKKNKDGKNKPGDKDDKKADAKDEENEPLFMPALGGSKQKEDPRFAKKRRPVKPKDGKNGENEKDNERDEMADHQNDQQRDLQSARDSLASDQQTLEQMLQQLVQAMQSKGKQGKGQPNDSEADAIAQQLQQMLQSPAMQAARSMADRMRQAQAMSRPQQGQHSRTPSQSARGDLNGNAKNGLSEADLSKLDPDMRAMILKLPPSRLRDELIQGMNEQGPEAYRAFIQDYFKRLTETKSGK
ncbi:MAG TPA: hypothetical protein VMG10_24115 [Gemmataceae bacterium]|nr:hypothetical protein [Gemmataceae bacterium]